MDAWNNAVYNYPDSKYDNTSYWVQSSSSNTIDVTVCQCPCDNLICKAGSGLCASPSDYLYVQYNSQTGNRGGVGFRNQSNSSVFLPITTADAPTYGNAFQGFSSPDNWVAIGSVIGPGNYTNLRYWLDPYPNSKPTGVYNTTWQIRLVQAPGGNPGDCGTCSC
jgi:hypothetical protein